MNSHVLTETNHLSREEWLNYRRLGLGGSDAGTVLGVNKWKTKFQLYLEKTGEYTEEINNEFIYWGNELEDIVAREFEKRSGKKVQKLDQLLQHPDHPFMLANLDRVIEGESALLECKTASAYNLSEWEGEEVPAHYLCQVQHYLAVTGFKTAYIAVLCGGNQFIWKKIARDDELIEFMIEQEKIFWEEHVLAEQPPAIDGSESSEELLKKLYPEDNGETIALGDQEDELLDALQSIKKELKELEELKRLYENKLKLKLEDAQKAVTPRYELSYKTIERNTIDSKRLKEEAPELAEKYTKTSTNRSLKIKKLETEG